MAPGESCTVTTSRKITVGNSRSRGQNRVNQRVPIKDKCTTYRCQWRHRRHYSPCVCQDARQSSAQRTQRPSGKCHTSRCLDGEREGKGSPNTHHPGTIHGQKALQDNAKPVVMVSRPLGDKTPFPNRVAGAVPFKTPAPETAKLAKLSLLEPEPAQILAPLLRPSSARKSLRIPLNGSAGRRASFKTPETQGNHWDVSDGDMDLGGDVAVEEVEVQEMEAEGLDDEIEYMPPTAIDLPYEPPFDMPDYKVLGRNLFEFAHSAPIDDSADLYYAADIELEIDTKELLRESGFIASSSEMEKLELPELEDDSPFVRKLVKPPAPIVTTKAPAHAPITRSATAAARALPIQPQTRASSRTVPSTATATSTSRPATRAMTSRAPSQLAVTSSMRTTRQPTSRDAIRSTRQPTATTSKSAAIINPSITRATAPIVLGRTSSTSSATSSNPATRAATSRTRSAAGTRATASIPSSTVKSGTATVPAQSTTKHVEDELVLAFRREKATDIEEDFLFDV
ncbi:hypothetical protein A0H81_09463 [Grifola frondosa]|uniref:Uncharacterized protein n=1 Tax=Grifola frondosa TaxID=5627 RepID=A0A1C7M655_GRIFR|nr:hypothetical protein A0H81_09463 [Grifola frondosa]